MDADLVGRAEIRQAFRTVAEQLFAEQKQRHERAAAWRAAELEHAELLAVLDRHIDAWYLSDENRGLPFITSEVVARAKLLLRVIADPYPDMRPGSLAVSLANGDTDTTLALSLLRGAVRSHDGVRWGFRRRAPLVRQVRCGGVVRHELHPDVERLAARIRKVGVS
jgi:hypothetical protein